MKLTNETDDAVYLKIDGDKFEIDMPAKCYVVIRQGAVEIKKVT